MLPSSRHPDHPTPGVEKCGGFGECGDPAALIHDIQGTDFRRPLTEARQIIEVGRYLERANVVFVADGLCRVTAELLAEFEAFKKRTRTHVFAVLLDISSSAGVSVPQWADQVHRVVDLARDAQAAQDAAMAVSGAVRSEGGMNQSPSNSRDMRLLGLAPFSSPASYQTLT